MTTEARPTRPVHFAEIRRAVEKKGGCQDSLFGCVNCITYAVQVCHFNIWGPEASIIRDHHPRPVTSLAERFKVRLRLELWDRRSGLKVR